MVHVSEDSTSYMNVFLSCEALEASRGLASGLAITILQLSVLVTVSHKVFFRNKWAISFILFYNRKVMV
jgi:hypothetical protein